jgi:hypothetical protein
MRRIKLRVVVDTDEAPPLYLSEVTPARSESSGVLLRLVEDTDENDNSDDAA